MTEAFTKRRLNVKCIVDGRSWLCYFDYMHQRGMEALTKKEFIPIIQRDMRILLKKPDLEVLDFERL